MSKSGETHRPAAGIPCLGQKSNISGGSADAMVNVNLTSTQSWS